MLLSAFHRAFAADGNARPGNGSDFWFNRWFVPTTSGVTVSPETLMNGQSATVYQCVDLISRCIAVMPITVFRRVGDNGRQVAPTHPAYRLLHDKPNQWQTPMEFKATMTAHCLLRGVAYAFQQYDPDGNIAQLKPLNPDLVEAELLESGRVNYWVRSAASTVRVLVKQEFMFVIRSLTLNGVKPLSPIQAAKNTIGIGVAAETYAGKSFKNGGVPSLAITHPEALGDDDRDRLKKEWMAEYGGSDNAGKIAVLDEGVKLEKLGLSSEDMELLNSRKWSKAEIGGIFGVPPFLLNLLENGASYASIEQFNLGFFTYTLMAWVIRWEESAERDLVTAPQIYYVKVVTEMFLRADYSKRMAGYTQSLAWMSPNEIRALEDLPPLDIPWMEEPLPPLNRGNAGGASSTPNDSNNSPSAAIPTGRVETAGQPMAEVKNLIGVICATVARAEKRGVSRVLEAAAGEPDVVLLDKMKQFYAKHQAYMLKTLHPIANAYAGRMGVESFDTDAMSAAYCKKRLAALPQAASRDAVLEALDPEAITSDLSLAITI